MTSDETIRKTVKVVDGILSADPQVAREMFGDEPDRIARALADAGLLAPASLREVATAEELESLVDRAFHAVVMHGDRYDHATGNGPEVQLWEWIGWPVGMWCPSWEQTCPIPPQTPPLPVRVLYVDGPEEARGDQ